MLHSLLPLASLARRAFGRPRLVLANGCFDPLHYGHLLHLEAAADLGDELVVALTSDAAVRREKGDARPLFNQWQRAHLLRGLRCVASVVIVDTVREALRDVRPAVFVKGIDYQGGIDPGDFEFCEQAGIEIAFTQTPKWSATALIHVLGRR